MCARVWALAVSVRKCARVVVFDLDNIFVILFKDTLEIWRVPGTSIPMEPCGDILITAELIGNHFFLVNFVQVI